MEEFAILSTLTIIISLIICFFGYRIIKIILPPFGFLIGAMIVGGAVSQFLTVEKWLIIIAGLIGGIIGAYLLKGIYMLGVFFLGAIPLGMMGRFFTFEGANIPQPVFSLIFALLGGILAVIFNKFMIIISTSIIGALGIIFGGYSLITRRFSTQQILHPKEMIIYLDSHQFYISAASLLILSLFGMVIQYRFTGKKR